MAEQQTESAHTFRVVRQEPVTVYRDVVLIETDDWLEAEAAAIDYNNRQRSTASGRELAEVRGTHPSHIFPGMGAACVTCGVPDNGCYGSHAPCGERPRKALVALVDEWREQRYPPGQSGTEGDAR